MKWHDHPMAWRDYAELLDFRGKPEVCVNAICHCLERQGKQAWNTQCQLLAEMKWTKNDRPYYDLYPSIAQAFTKVNLERVQCQHLRLPVPELLIRLPVGHEIEGSKETKIRTILVAESVSKEQKCPGWIVAVNDGSREPMGKGNKNIVIHTVCGVSLVPGSFIASRLAAGRAKPYCDDVIDNDAVDTALRIISTLCLLKENPDLIEPLPLESDRAKWEATHDPKYIEKAKRRGKVGWAIGRHVETCPGFRSPHFAIRWMGKGSIDPQLRPIRGCIVHREKVTETPTDWLGPDEGIPE